jgi:hypothetical protein
LNILLQSSETLSGGELLAVHKFAVKLSEPIFRVGKTSFISTWFAKVNDLLQQLKLNMEHIAQSMPFAAPSNARSEIEQAQNNFNLHKTHLLQSGTRLHSYAEFNSNKTYYNKHQYIAVQAGTTITKIEDLAESNRNNTNSLVYGDVG